MVRSAGIGENAYATCAKPLAITLGVPSVILNPAISSGPNHPTPLASSAAQSVPARHAGKRNPSARNDIPRGHSCIVEHDALEDFEQSRDLNLQTGLFAHLAPHRKLQGARRSPPRRRAATSSPSAARARVRRAECAFSRRSIDQRAHSEHRPRRIPP